MFRTLIFAGLLAFSSVGFAQNANPCDNIPTLSKNMSSGEVEVLLRTCRTDPNGATVTNVLKNVTPETANNWSSAAKNYAEAIGIAAKELGIAANDFLNSPAGWLLAAILILNYAGALIIGFPLSIFTLLLWAYMMRYIHRGDREYIYVPVLWGMFTWKRIAKESTEKTEYTAVWSIFSGLAVLIMNGIIWANIT